MTPKAHYKNSELFDKLNAFFGEKYESRPNKVYITYNFTLCKVQT